MTSSKINQELITSRLFDEKTFYQSFIRDLEKSRHEVIIESPFITSERVRVLNVVFEKLVNKGVKVYIITRDPNEHSKDYQVQSENEIRYFEEIGVQVFICKGNHHRKLAILDKSILWEGSLNILSQTYSREIMRRISGKEAANEMLEFLKLDQYL